MGDRARLDGARPRMLPARHRRRGTGHAPDKVAATYDDTEIRARMRDELEAQGRRRLGPAPADARHVAAVAAARRHGGAPVPGLDGRRARPTSADAPRRPLVLARGRARDRGAPALPGLSRRRPRSFGSPRPQRRLADRAGSRARRSSRRSSACRTRASAPPVGSPRRALRAIPRDWDYVVHHPAATDPATSASRASAATTRPRGGTSGRGSRSASPASRRPPTRRTSSSGSSCRSASGPRRGGARRPALDRRDAGRERRAAPLPVDLLLARDPRRARAALSRRGFALVGRLDDAGGRRRAASRATRSTGSSPPANVTIDAFDRPDPRAARGRRGIEPLRLAAHGLRVRRGRGRHAVAHPLGRRLARVLLQRRPVLLRPPEEPRVPAFVHGRDAADDRRRRRRRRAADVRRWARGGSAEDLEELGDAAEALVDGRLTYEEALAGYFPRLLDAYGGDRARSALRGRPRGVTL